MSELAPKPPVDAKMTERGRVAQAYARLFGRTDSARSEDQRIVWEDMERRGFIRRPTLTYDGKGQLCPLRMAQGEGQRIFHLDTQLLVHEGCSLDPEAKPKRKGRSIT